MIRAVIVRVLVCLVGACDQSPSPRRDARDTGASNDGCIGFVARRLQPGPDSLSEHERCRLASRAYARLVGRARTDVSAEGDAQRITRITVISANRLDPETDSVLEVHWIVHFSLSRRPYDIEAIADGIGSDVVLRRSEKM